MQNYFLTFHDADIITLSALLATMHEQKKLIEYLKEKVIIKRDGSGWVVATAGGTIALCDELTAPEAELMPVVSNSPGRGLTLIGRSYIGIVENKLVKNSVKRGHLLHLYNWVMHPFFLGSWEHRKGKTS